MADFNMEEYRQPWETGPHWELKREFMEKYKDDYPVDRLLCLAQAYFNIELLHCSYPEPVMQEVRRLSYQLQGCKRFREAAQNLEKLKKEQPELQTKRGKRNFSDDCSSKPFKFIKFCSPSKTEPSKESIESADSETGKESLSNNISLDAGDKCTSLHICNETYVYSLLQSPDFGCIKKLSGALPKKYPSPCDGMESAVETCGLEDVVKYTFVSQNSSESWCQLYVGNTLLSTGRSGNDRSARTRAAEYALYVLKNLCNLPHKTLNDLKQEWQKWIEKDKTIPSGIINSNSPMESKIFASLTHMENDPNYKDLYFVMKFIQELKSVLEKQLTINKSQKPVCPAQLLQQIAFKKVCDSSNVFFFNFYEDPYTPMHLRLYYCDLVINKIFICQGKGSNKKLARTDAAELGILFLTKFFDLDEQSEKPEQIHEKKKTLQTQLQLEKRKIRQSMNNMNVASSSSVKDYPHPKSSVAKSTPHKKDQSNSNFLRVPETVSKQPSKDNLPSEKISGCTAPSFHAENNVRYDTGFKTEPRIFTVNPVLLSNSYQRQLVLYDQTECGSQQTPSSILHCSVNKCKRKMVCEIDEFKHDPKEPTIFRFSVSVDGEHVGSGCAFTKQEAKLIAQQNALRKLQETVYTIKVKNEVDKSFIVSRNQILNATDPASALTDSNIGCKMLKTMGWTGGAIGKSGGITEPITASEHKYHQGLGFSSNLGKETDFKRKIEALLHDYSNSNTTSDLIFSTDFTKDERKLIHGVVAKYRLLSNSKGGKKGGDRQLFISRKITPMDLLNLLVYAGGSTEKYELEDRSTWQV